MTTRERKYHKNTDFIKKFRRLNNAWVEGIPFISPKDLKKLYNQSGDTFYYRAFEVTRPRRDYPKGLDK